MSSKGYRKTLLNVDKLLHVAYCSLVSYLGPTRTILSIINESRVFRTNNFSQSSMPREIGTLFNFSGIAQSLEDFDNQLYLRDWIRNSIVSQAILIIHHFSNPRQEMKDTVELYAWSSEYLLNILHAYLYRAFLHIEYSNMKRTRV